MAGHPYWEKTADFPSDEEMSNREGAKTQSFMGGIRPINGFSPSILRVFVPSRFNNLYSGSVFSTASLV